MALSDGWSGVRAGLMRWAAQVGLPCQLDIDVAEGVPPPSSRQAAVLLGLCGALLQNVARHAHATGVEVRMSATASDLTLRVKDNGKGAPPSAFDPPGVHSLSRLRQEVVALNGWLQIDSQPGQGTQAILSLPLFHRSKSI